MRPVWFSVIGLVAAGLCFLIPLLWLYPWQLDDLLKSSPPGKGDLIVILEGDHYSRIDHAFALMEDGFSRTIYFPSPTYDVNIAYLEEKRKELKDRQVLYTGTAGAVSTFDEAVKTKRFLSNHPEVDTILLVTASYHSYRAWWIFSNVLQGYRVVSTPVPYDIPWEIDGVVDESHRHVRYAKSERRKFLASYLIYGWLF